MSISKKAFSGVKWSTASSIVVSLTQLLQIVILSKILSPADFGLMAIIVFLLNFSQIFLDLGLSNAIIYKQNLSQKQLSTLYFINIIIGFFVFLVVYSCSGLIASFYKEDKLKHLIEIISIAFFIIPFGQQYQALLRKELVFKSIAIRDIISRTVGFFATIMFAINGMGVLSLVYGNLIYNGLGTFLLIITGRRLFNPSFEFSIQSIQELLNFGFFQMGEKIVNFLNKEIDTLIIGRLLGMESLGIYNIAKDFISKPYQIINPIITKVSFPVMAKFQQNNRKIKLIYLNTLENLSLINSIIFIFSFFFAKDIVMVVFGNEWISAVEILRILSIYMLIRSIGNPVGALQLALGKASLGFYWNLALLLLIPLFVYFGSYFDLMGVAYSLLFSQIVLYYPSWKYMVYRLVPISFSEYNMAQVNYLVSSLIACLISFGLVSILPFENYLLRFILGGVLSIILYIIFVFATNKRMKSQILFFVKK